MNVPKNTIGVEHYQFLIKIIIQTQKIKQKMTKFITAFLLLISTALSFDVVKDGGADPLGLVDSTPAFIAAAKSTIDTLRAIDTADGRSLYSNPVTIPEGRYLITKAISGWGPAVVIKSDRAIINQQGNDNTFVFTTASKVNISGLQFVNGNNAIYLTNANINGTEYKITNCNFMSCIEYGIKTELSPNQTNLSAILTVNDCEFNSCGGALQNACDFTSVRDCWVNGFKSGACFYSTRGRLDLNHVIMVPLQYRLSNKYWISTYSDVKATDCVFSGENGGNPILKYNGNSGNAYPYMGGMLIFRGCQMSAGQASFSGSAVITLEDKAMFQLLKMSECNYLVDVPIIVANGTNLADTINAVVKKELLSIEFESCKSWPLINTTIASTRIPSLLLPYTKVK